MRNPITKLAVAAVIIISIVAGIYFITGKAPTVTCCAWAQLAEQVAQIKTFMYQMHMTQSGSAIPAGKQEIEIEAYLSSEYGYRMDTYVDGNAATTMYMLPKEKAMVSIIPPAKKYMRMAMNDLQLEKWRKQNQDPREMFKKFAEGEYTEIGSEVIDGITVKGIEVNNPGAFKGMFDKFSGRLWVDVKTELPVRMEMEIELSAGGQSIQTSVVMDNFEWGIDLAPDVFEPNIPADYTSMGEMKMPGQDEAAAIEGLRAFAEISDGNYPSSMNMMTVIQEAQQEIVKSMGFEPNKPPTDEQTQQMMQKTMTIQGACAFYMKLTQDGNDPAYYGDRVTPSDANGVLMRWRISDSEYRVIYGDLRAETVTADKLAELEAATSPQ